jgi:pimeloyl-ACP methyl ester carboxylesterase
MSEATDFGTFGRFEETSVSDMPRDMKEAYDFTMKLRGLVPGPHRIWLANPELSKTVVPIGAYYQTRSTLTKPEIEIATNLVNGHWSAAYSNYEHEIIGEKAGGLPPEKVEAMIAGRQTSFDDPRRPKSRDFGSEVSTMKVLVSSKSPAISIPVKSPAISFPVGYHDLHPNISINFQLNRFYGWVGDDSMLMEMREAVAGVNDYPMFTKIILELAERALARHEVLKGAYYLRLAEFFLLTSDPRKLPTRQRFVDLLLDHLRIAPSAYSRIPFESGWLPAYRLMPIKPKGTLVVFGGFDSYIEEWLPAALVFRDAGYDTILFEGPGQGAALELAHLTMSHEWEKPVKAVLDYFHLDAVTLMGFSLGGGLVIRAAAFDPRVRWVIAYDIMTSGLECALRPLPPPAQKELLGWINTRNDAEVDKFFADAMAKSLLLDWMLKLGMHNTGQRTPYAMMKHYQKFETASISCRVTQDVLLMAGAEDHYVPVHQLPDQIATLTHVRSLTARLFTRAEQAQNHCQVGNMGLAFRVMIDWMESLESIERLNQG